MCNFTKITVQIYTAHDYTLVECNRCNALHTSRTFDIFVICNKLAQGKKAISNFDSSIMNYHLRNIIASKYDSTDSTRYISAHDTIQHKEPSQYTGKCQLRTQTISYQTFFELSLKLSLKYSVLKNLTHWVSDRVGNTEVRSIHVLKSMHVIISLWPCDVIWGRRLNQHWLT